MAAAVVVANPLAPPVRDLQISTTQLSTSPEALIPFDKNLLRSISQPSASSTFNAALAQILGALAAEADRIGIEVNSSVSTALVPAASASRTPPVYAPLSADVPARATPNASTTLVPAAAAATTPTIEQVVSEVTADTAYLGNKVVEAAYAAVNALVNTPYVLFKAVQAVFVGDLATAFATIVQAIKAFFNPGLILVGGLGDFIDQYALPPHKSTPSASAAAANSRVAAPPATVVGGTGRSATDPETAAAEPGSGKPRQTTSTGSAKHAAAQVTQTPEPVDADATSPADQPASTPGSVAGSPGTGSASRSPGVGNSDSPDRPKPRTPGGSRPGPGSDRNQSSGGHGASAAE